MCGFVLETKKKTARRRAVGAMHVSTHRRLFYNEAVQTNPFWVDSSVSMGLGLRTQRVPQASYPRQRLLRDSEAQGICRNLCDGDLEFPSVDTAPAGASLIQLEHIHLHLLRPAPLSSYDTCREELHFSNIPLRTSCMKRKHIENGIEFQFHSTIYNQSVKTSLLVSRTRHLCVRRPLSIPSLSHAHRGSRWG